MTRRIRVKVYEADGTTLVDTLTADVVGSRGWLEDLNNPGSWSFIVPLDEPDVDLLADDRIVRFFLDDVARFQGPIDSLRKVAADPDKRLTGRELVVSGRGGLALLERAVVLLEPLMQGLPYDERYFNAASSAFDDSTWTPAVDLAPVTESDTAINPKYPNPVGWEDELAVWIWDATGFTPPTAVGDVHFRKGEGPGGLGFSISSDTAVRIAVAADDFVELYLNGCKIAAETQIDNWKKVSTVDLPMVAGTHTIYLKGTNADRPDPSTNGAAVLLSIRELVGGIELGPPILYSSSVFFKMLAYPAEPPGMTPGAILVTLLEEAQARGTLPELSWSFTATDDSDGVAWPTKVDVSFPVGTTYLEVIRHFVDEHLLDVSFDADSLTLNLHVDRGNDLAAGVAAKLGPAIDANLSKLVYDRKAPGPNVVFAKDATGRWTETLDGTAAAAYGRRETPLALGRAPTNEAAARQVTAYLEDRSEPIVTITDAQIEEVDAGPVPFVDYNVGDRMFWPDYVDGTASRHRIYGLAIGEDEAGNPIVTPELVE